MISVHSGLFKFTVVRGFPTFNYKAQMFCLNQFVFMEKNKLSGSGSFPLNIRLNSVHEKV